MQAMSGPADAGMDSSSRGNPEPLRFGVMCNGAVFPAWQARCLDELLALGYVKPALLILDGRPREASSWRKAVARRRARKDLLWTLYSRLLLDKRFLATRPVNMEATFTGVPKIRCGVIRKGKYSEYFTPEDVATIRDSGLDFILRFSFGIIRGEILDSARFGVWSFHHDDEEKFRGGPPCFWEIYAGDPVTGSMLQRLTDRLDGGIVLHKGHFRTISHSYVRNRDAAYFGSADWPARVCKDIRNGTADYLDSEPSSSYAPVRHNPTARQTMVFVFKIARNFVSNQLRCLFRTDLWNVGVVEAPIQSFLDPEARPAVRWLSSSLPGRYLADPFGHQEGASLTVLAEDYDYKRGNGVISSLTLLPDGGVSGPEKAMELSRHASYPYLVEHDGEIYCIPESFETKEVTLYRATSFPDQWTKVASLIHDFPALDPTLFWHGGRWWLFCTDHDRGPNSKLYAWHAAELSGPWTAHAANPLKTDVRSSRPAGTPFEHEGILYRPAQDNSGTYGGRVVINKVIRLSDVEFEEKVAVVVPAYDEGVYDEGLHTISRAGDLTLIDGKRSAFVWPAFRHELAWRVRKLIHAAPPHRRDDIEL